MREQIFISIGFEAGEADVFHYRIVRSQQILRLAAVAVSPDNNTGHFRDKSRLYASTWADWRKNSGVDYHGHVVALSWDSVAVFGTVI